MTPADEIEYIINESISTEVFQIIKTYQMSTFPEIALYKLSNCYILSIKKEYNENVDVIKRYNKVCDSLKSRKMTIKNRMVDTYRRIALQGSHIDTFAPIYYKDCIFTYEYTLLGNNCENCIVGMG